MSRRKLRGRQRTFFSIRMKIVAGAAVSILSIVLLILYFNFSEIKDTKAFSSGDYRTVASGNWDDVTVWEVFDGENWSPAIEPPGDGVRKILVTNNQKMTVTDEIPLNLLIIDEGSKVTIESNTIKISKFKNEGGLICNGTLELGSAILEGNGDLMIGSEAVLMIGSDTGIDKKAMTGNIQMTGKRVYHKDATYVFNGSVSQHTGNGLPVSIKNLVIDNSSGVTLDQQIQILGNLNLVNGVLSTGKHTLTLGTSVLNTCSITSEAGSFSGNVKIWFGAQNFSQLGFPLSDGISRYKIGFTSNHAVFQKGLIEFVYREGVPDDSQKSPFEARQVVVAITEKGYFAVMLTNGPEEAWLQLSDIKDDGTGAPEIIWEISKKTDSGSPVLSSATKATGSATRIKAISNIVYGPAPFKNHLVVRFYSDFKTTASIQMINSKGKMVQMENIKVEEGYNQFVFNGSGNLIAGPYMIQISNPSEIHTFKVQCDKSREPLIGS